MIRHRVGFNRAGRPCCVSPDGVHDVCPSLVDARLEADRRDAVLKRLTSRGIAIRLMPARLTSACRKMTA